MVQSALLHAASQQRKPNFVRVKNPYTNQLVQVEIAGKEPTPEEASAFLEAFRKESQKKPLSFQEQVKEAEKNLTAPYGKSFGAQRFPTTEGSAAIQFTRAASLASKRLAFLIGKIRSGDYGPDQLPKAMALQKQIQRYANTAAIALEAEGQKIRSDELKRMTWQDWVQSAVTAPITTIDSALLGITPKEFAEYAPEGGRLAAGLADLSAMFATGGVAGGASLGAKVTASALAAPMVAHTAVEKDVRALNPLQAFFDPNATWEDKVLAVINTGLLGLGAVAGARGVMPKPRAVKEIVQKFKVDPQTAGRLYDAAVQKLGAKGQKEAVRQAGNVLRAKTTAAQRGAKGSTAKPKAEPEVGSTPTASTKDATGLANQVQERETIAGVLDEVESAGGKSPEDWHSVGRKAVEEGADWWRLAEDVAKRTVELTGRNVGILLEGKRLLRQEVERTKLQLEAEPGSAEYAKAYQDAKNRLQEFAENVQVGKGRWSDVGRALQAGTTLDEGSFAQVLEEASRFGKVSSRTEGQIRDLTGKVAERDARIAELEQAFKEGGVVKPRAKKADRDSIQKEIEGLFAEFKSLREKAAGAGASGPKTRGAVAKITAEDLKNLESEAVVLGKIVKAYVRLGAATVDELVTSVQSAIKSQLGIELDRQAVIDLGAPAKGKTRNQIEKDIASLRARLKSESSAEKAKLQEKIDALKKQIETGDFRVPSKQEITLSKELSDLRAERDLYARKVRRVVHQHAEPLLIKGAQEVSGLIRGLQLGTDFGMLLRQGLFAWSRPVSAAKGLASAGKAVLSERNLAKAESEITDRRLGGQHMGIVRRKAGLSLSDSISDPEELVLTRLAQKIPILKHFTGALARGQTAFINRVRSDVFDSFWATTKNVTDKELKDRAAFINAATGRGNIRQPHVLLQVALTSPRYEASRWQTIWEAVKNPPKAILGNKGAIANVQDMAVTAGGVYGLFKLAELSGYSVEWNPESGDFLKLRKRKEVWDVSAGLAPRIRDILRFYVAIRNPEYGKSLPDVAGKAVTRTISPAVRTPIEQASITAQRASGKAETDIKSPFAGHPEMADLEGIWPWMPLIVQTMKAASGEEGANALTVLEAGAKEFIGTSVNYYAGANKFELPKESWQLFKDADYEPRANRIRVKMSDGSEKVESDDAYQKRLKAIGKAIHNDLNKRLSTPEGMRAWRAMSPNAKKEFLQETARFFIADTR